jgi:hypothetical protein
MKLREIEPLPGGLDSLRRALQTPTRRPRLRRSVLAVAVAAAAMALWVTLRPPPDRNAMDRLFRAEGPGPVAVKLGVASAPVQESVSDPRVPPSDQVIFVWVASR